MWIAVAGLAVLYLCSTLPTPLYPLYQRDFGIVGASALCFLLATSTAWLYIARILNGLAAGLGAGALTA